MALIITTRYRPILLWVNDRLKPWLMLSNQYTSINSYTTDPSSPKPPLDAGYDSCLHICMLVHLIGAFCWSTFHSIAFRGHCLCKLPNQHIRLGSKFLGPESSRRLVARPICGTWYFRRPGSSSFRQPSPSIFTRAAVRMDGNPVCIRLPSRVESTDGQAGPSRD